jgi:hypothetical protein
LTIKGKDDVVSDEDEVNYLMDSPNLEVRKSLVKHVLLSYIDESERQEIAGLSSQFLKSALDEDAQTFAETILRAFVHLPYTINETKNENKDEGGESFYHAMLVCSMISMGFDVTAEKITNLGRADIIWKYQNKVFIIELKFVDRYTYTEKQNTDTGKIIILRHPRPEADIAKEIDEKIESALSQIKDKKYYESYVLQKKEVILVGVAVSTKAQDVKAKFEKL